MSTIIGVDFSGAQDERQSGTWVAQGRLEDNGALLLDSVYPILRDDLYNLLITVEPPAVVALDFPFGLPNVFLKALRIYTNTLQGVWSRAHRIPFDQFGHECTNFDTHPKRVGDQCYPVSESALNKRLVPMTYRGIEMLHKLTTARPNRWWIPPRDSGDTPPDRVTLLEVMPGALLYTIGLNRSTAKGYKKAKDALKTRCRVINRLLEYAEAEFEAVNLVEFRRGCIANADYLDAVIAIVAAALWARNEDDSLHRPEDHENPAVLEAARLEGWIYAPNPPDGGNPRNC